MIPAHGHVHVSTEMAFVVLLGIVVITALVIGMIVTGRRDREATKRFRIAAAHDAANAQTRRDDQARLRAKWRDATRPAPALEDETAHTSFMPVPPATPFLPLQARPIYTAAGYPPAPVSAPIVASSGNDFLSGMLMGGVAGALLESATHQDRTVIVEEEHFSSYTPAPDFEPEPARGGFDFGNTPDVASDAGGFDFSWGGDN